MDFSQFETVYVPVNSPVAGDLKIHTKKAGSSGPVLVLLHGYPQTYYIWHRIAQRLVDAGYTVIVPDLRGYGDSSKPKGSESHIEYSKREMANDVVAVASHFGYDSFNLIAHDRGARVAHRLALDHPKAVLSLMILDIAPTLYMYEHTDMEFATKYWHWFMKLTPQCEAIIAGNPEAWFKQVTRDWDGFTPEARESYYKNFEQPDSIHGCCEDYRAAASLDLEYDREDLKNGHKLSVPRISVLWGDQGLIPKYGDVVGVWKDHSEDHVNVTGRAVESNHYIPEMASEDVYKEILELVPLK